MEGSVCSQNVIIIIKIPISSSRQNYLIIISHFNQLINQYSSTNLPALLRQEDAQIVEAILKNRRRQSGISNEESPAGGKMELKESRLKAREKEGPSQQKQKVRGQEKARESHSVGFNFSQLLQETIIEVIFNLQANQRQAEQQLRKQIKRIQSFDLKQVSFKECHGYYLLPKLYYLQEKCKELKISFAKASKQKNQLLEKVKGGLRRHDHIEQMYSIFADKRKASPARQKEAKS